MPRVDVILKNGTVIPVEEANDAHWEFQLIAERAQSATLLLIVENKQSNKVETRGKFISSDVVGYKIDVR